MFCKNSPKKNFNKFYTDFFFYIYASITHRWGQLFMFFSLCSSLSITIFLFTPQTQASSNITPNPFLPFVFPVYNILYPSLITFALSPLHFVSCNIHFPFSECLCQLYLPLIPYSKWQLLISPVSLL